MRYTLKPRCVQICRGSGYSLRVLREIPVRMPHPDDPRDVDPIADAGEVARKMLKEKYDGLGFVREHYDVSATMDGRRGWSGPLGQWMAAVWEWWKQRRMG